MQGVNIAYDLIFAVIEGLETCCQGLSSLVQLLGSVGVLVQIGVKFLGSLVKLIHAVHHVVNGVVKLVQVGQQVVHIVQLGQVHILKEAGGEDGSGEFQFKVLCLCSDLHIVRQFNVLCRLIVQQAQAV